MVGGATLAERLGYAAEDRLLIVNCDDLGMCNSANEGVYDCLRNGIATSATLMVPCPWAREAAARQYPLPGIGSTDELADLMAWLLSAQAARVTGQVWSMDAGFSTIRPLVK